MSTYTLESGNYPGITVFYTYQYAREAVSYSFYGEFNGATPQMLDIEIEDIKVENVSILDYVSLSVWEGLEEEISQAIKATV
jgi:hypothetical protein